MAKTPLRLGLVPIDARSAGIGGHWLLTRRSIAILMTWPTTPVLVRETYPGLAVVAGTRWPYEAWPFGWYRQHHLAMLAHAFLAVTRPLVAMGKGGGELN